ncbi:fibronectin type III domain-containing protein [Micromonospora antibiotica]|uniref:Fibronectin type III domain-containing protein n=1 Tax=Micromonospora antibiotica TaxID=2807623 RepID=A0ABS3VFE3_9ACTN|nr:fibronectin type III domain-containing protein [Micromonospora antibiotica]MBO4164262.1 fibronectin type III domain-containing protein [Micromonospora antibiotica]
MQELGPPTVPGPTRQVVPQSGPQAPAQAGAPTGPGSSAGYDGGRGTDRGVPPEVEETGYPELTPSYPARDGRPRRRGRTVAVVVGVVVLAVGGTIGAVTLSRDADGPQRSTGAAPRETAGPPPADLKLRDDAATITVTWSDPSNGSVPFMVAGGRTGRALGVMATVDPGQTSFTVNGLNAEVNYCFTVLAVYSTDAFATSGQVCTDRVRPSPSG